MLLLQLIAHPRHPTLSALASTSGNTRTGAFLPTDRFRPCYCDLCVSCTRTLHSSCAITGIIDWTFSFHPCYDFLCPERHTGLIIPESLKAAISRLDGTRFLCLNANRHTTNISFGQNVYTSGRILRSIRGLCSCQQCVELEFASTELSQTNKRQHVER